MNPTEIAGLNSAPLHLARHTRRACGVRRALVRTASNRCRARPVLACAALTAMLALPFVTAYGLTAAPATIRAVGQVVGTNTVARRDALSNPVGNGQTVIGFAQGPTAGSQNASGLFMLVTWLWVAGVAVLSMRMAAGCWRIGRLHRLGQLASNVSAWQLAADRLAARLHLRAPSTSSRRRSSILQRS